MQNRSLRSIWLLVTVFTIAGVAVSCYTPPPRVIPPQPLAPLETRVYAAPSVDWSSKAKIKLDFQEKGSLGATRNQILEQYLLTEASNLLARKGYTVVDTGASATLRIYYGIEEKPTAKLEETVIAYSNPHSPSIFLTSLSLAAGVWTSASVSTATWRTITQADYYEASISLELYDENQTQQLWRGDVFIPTDSRDIRTCSNYMMRELLWYFPAIGYNEIVTPSASTSEFEELWSNYLVGREFFVPGLRNHISFLFDEQLSWEELEEAFQQSAEYQTYTQSLRPWDKKGKTPGYEAAFEQWYNRQGYRLVEETVKHLLNEHISCLPGYIDLLQTAPIALRTLDSRLHLFGAYKFGNDLKYLHLIAHPRRQQKYIQHRGRTYIPTTYILKELEECDKTEIDQLYEDAISQREVLVGTIDDLN